jgi:hypothetical protein
LRFFFGAGRPAGAGQDFPVKWLQASAGAVCGFPSLAGFWAKSRFGTKTPTIHFLEYHKPVPFYTVLVQSQYFVLRYRSTK